MTNINITPYPTFEDWMNSDGNTSEQHKKITLMLRLVSNIDNIKSCLTNKLATFRESDDLFPTLGQCQILTSFSDKPIRIQLNAEILGAIKYFEESKKAKHDFKDWLEQLITEYLGKYFPNHSIKRVGTGIRWILTTIDNWDCPIGPAYQDDSGYAAWWVNGKQHRIDGPAQINQRCEPDCYYIEGVEYSKEEFEKLTNPAKELTINEIEKLLGYKIKVIGNDSTT